MIFVADEGVDGQIVDALRENDHTVIYIAEVESGISDEEVLKLANENDAILMTRDKDFGELVFLGKKVNSGIVLNRLYELDSMEKAKLIMGVVEKYGNDLRHSFTVIQPGKVRIRKL